MMAYMLSSCDLYFYNSLNFESMPSSNSATLVFRASLVRAIGDYCQLDSSDAIRGDCDQDKIV